MNLNATTLAALILVVRTAGRPTAVRALTLPQSVIKAIPGRQNADLAGISAQAGQLAEQAVQLAEAIYTKDWSDPDLLEVSPDVAAAHASLLAAAGAHP